MKTKYTLFQSVDDCVRAKQDGWDAGLTGDLAAESPYRAGSIEHHAWTLSWADANAWFFAREQNIRKG